MTMNEIYWITRLDNIGIWFVILSVLAGIFLVIATIIYFVVRSSFLNKGEDSDKSWMEFWGKWIKRLTVAFFIVMPLSILTPTTKEAMLIWGVGTTVDYIKSNKTIQQLPDKCVDALDAWVESLSEDKKEEK